MFAGRTGTRASAAKVQPRWEESIRWSKNPSQFFASLSGGTPYFHVTCLAPNMYLPGSWGGWQLPVESWMASEEVLAVIMQEDALRDTLRDDSKQ